jgi:hypothetical protein
MDKGWDAGRPLFPMIELTGTPVAAAWSGFAERWSRHRLQDVQSTIELAVRPWGTLDPRELAEMQQKWMAGIVDRYMLDALAFAENAMSLPLGDVVPPAAARASAVKPATDGSAASHHRVKRHGSVVA